MNKPPGPSTPLPAFLGVALVAAVIAGVFTIGLSVVVDRLSRPSIEMGTAVMPDVVVQIGGEVATPGVYYLPAGARVADVVAAAGGLTDDAGSASLNLAARVGDGESILLAPEIGATPVHQAQGAGSLEPAAGPINVNTASAAELETLPDIGPVRAGRIVDYRDEAGPFLTVDDLTRIDGISEAIVDELRPLVTVDDVE